jgi:hypothetical protein
MTDLQDKNWREMLRIESIGMAKRSFHKLYYHHVTCA